MNPPLFDSGNCPLAGADACLEPDSPQALINERAESDYFRRLPVPTEYLLARVWAAVDADRVDRQRPNQKEHVA